MANLNLINHLTGCTVEGVETEYSLDDTISVTLTANDGTSFVVAPQMVGTDSIGDHVIVEFTISDDAMTASLTYDPSDGTIDTSKGVLLTGGTTPVTSITNYGAVNVYVVTPDNLTAFARTRFHAESTGETDSSITDLGVYVVSLFRLPVSVGTSATDTLKVGDFTTPVEVGTPASDTISVDFGDILLTAHNQDIVDYDTEISLFLPFKGMVSVPSDYVGQTINLKYHISVVTGDTTAVLSCNGISRAMYDMNVAQAMAYRMVSGSTIGAGNWNGAYLKGLQPYVILKWYNSLNQDINVSSQRMILGDATGYIEATDISEISGNGMLADEQEMIEQLLSNGVYIE